VRSTAVQVQKPSVPTCNSYDIGVRRDWEASFRVVDRLELGSQMTNTTDWWAVRTTTDRSSIDALGVSDGVVECFVPFQVNVSQPTGRSVVLLNESQRTLLVKNNGFVCKRIE
jgi:hypothetical protein